MHEHAKKALDKMGSMHSDHRMTEHAGEHHKVMHEIEKRQYSDKKHHRSSFNADQL